MPKTLSGFFVLIFLLSMASALPFFLLAENIRFIRETYFLLSITWLYHRFDFYHLLVCIISILLSSALHAAYRRFSGTNVLCLAIIAINGILLLAAL